MKTTANIIREQQEAVYDSQIVLVDWIQSIDEDIPASEENLRLYPSLFYAGIVITQHYAGRDYHETDQVDYTDLLEHRSIDQLTAKEQRQLRQQIRVGSLYLADYKNDFGMTKDEVCSLADSYQEWLFEEAETDDWSTAMAQDSPEKFAEYCDIYYGSAPEQAAA